MASTLQELICYHQDFPNAIACFKLSSLFFTHCYKVLIQIMFSFGGAKGLTDLKDYFPSPFYFSPDLPSCLSHLFLQSKSSLIEKYIFDSPSSTLPFSLASPTLPNRMLRSAASFIVLSLVAIQAAVAILLYLDASLL